MSIFEKWDSEIKIEDLIKEEKNIGNGKSNGELEPVPYGTYEVKVKKMEIKASKNNDPMLSVWFEVVTGDYKSRLIFMNQLINTPYGLHNAKEFLRNLDSRYEIDFVNFTQFKNLVLDVLEKIDGNLEYALEYSQNKKGYNQFKIMEVFEV